jgi:DNA helicase-2/ATP-dependent DNA helicase PcrA
VESILAGLNPAQREAALATTGPVAILAGAGTGKTTTITRRIACQVATGAFPPEEILAVTFTEKAAGELRERLRALGVLGVEARTFHAAALRQLAELWPAHRGGPLPRVLDAKGPVIASLANALPRPYRFVARRELAGEIEWAKNRMIPPDRYRASIQTEGHQPPIPPDLMDGIYRGYERRKASMDRLDFEDMLGLLVRLLDEVPAAAAAVRSRYAAFTVDEFQDVNPLQAALLDRWMGGRHEVCVVGDDYQTIYAFTGASPSHLLNFPDVHPMTHVVRLEENYRSTPEVLDVANRLVPRMGGFEKHLRATVPSGPPPTIRPVTGGARAEVGFVVEEVRRLVRQGIRLEQIAVLYRINARSEAFEEALAEAGIPYQVRDDAFLRRPGPRAVLHRLRGQGGDVVTAVNRATDEVGFDPSVEPDSDEEVTRQADLARLRAMAREFSAGAEPGAGAEAFVADLGRRFAAETSGRGVNLLTYHRAKGLEFDAVFLPMLLDGELPFRSGRSKADEAEERRLLYVGITRARRHLFLTWPVGERSGRSRFVDEVAPSAAVVGLRQMKEAAAGGQRGGRTGASSGRVIGPPDGGLYEALRTWRRTRSAADGVPAYVVFHDATLAAIAYRRPRSERDLLGIPGVGPAKLERYGDDVLAVVAGGGT